ncbi:MAG: phosphoribosyltransferase [Kibdelosporangium sp.]
MRFRDRKHAGEKLAELLRHYDHRPAAQILALPRGGVPVARAVADALGLPMDVFLVRKLGLPDQEELAMGAIADGDVVVLNDELAGPVPEIQLRQVIEQETRELRRRRELYRGDRPLPELEGRTVILVDDGLATGASMRAAVRAIRRLRPDKVVVAVPAAPKSIFYEFTTMVDEVVCVTMPEPFGAVGSAYQDFAQVSDTEVRRLLAPRRGPGPSD